ncbi:MAG: hypothetical protein ACO3RO_06960, partial [Flavobacteriaceae bacterium]
ASLSARSIAEACMKRSFFRALAKLNKKALPSLSRRGIDPAKAKKWQIALLGYRYYVTKESLDE